jgi:hypothetical protein
MENVDQLFQLVHTLSKSEKRRFKIFSSLQSGNKMYMRLFDLIEKQKKYDEKKLKSKLRISGFAVAKVYLYNLILKSLRLQNPRSDKKKIIIELLENAENLLKRGLADQSQKQLIKAKKIAKQYQQFFLLIEAYQIQHAIANFSQDARFLKELYSERNKEFDYAVAALKEQFEYRKGINLIIYKCSMRGRVLRSEKEKNNIENEVMGLLNRDPKECLSFKAKTLHYNFSSLHYNSVNNFIESHNQNKKSIQHLNSNTDMLMQQLPNYIDSVNNIIYALIKMGRYEEVMYHIDKIKGLPVESITDKARIFAFVTGGQILYYLKTGQHQTGMGCIPEWKKQLSIYKDKLNVVGFYALCLDIEAICFASEDYRQALQWNNKVLNHPEIKLHYDFYSNARIAELIIHYELNNVDTFQSLVRSYNLFLKKNSFTGKFEQAFLNFFKQLSKTIDEQKHKHAFIHFFEQLTELSANSYERELFDVFDLQGWLRSKIDSRRFSDVYNNAKPNN